MSRSDQSSFANDWLVHEERALKQAGSQLEAQRTSLAELFTGTAKRVRECAARIDVSLAVAELRAKPPPDLDAIIDRLRLGGADVLSARERRLVAGVPERVPVVELQRLLSRHPALGRHTLRACVANWRSYLEDDWGDAYQSLLVQLAASSDLPPFGRLPVAAEQFFERPPQERSTTTRGGHAFLAQSVHSTSILDTYQRLQSDLRLRDSWTLTSYALVASLAQSLRRGMLLDEAFDAICQHPRLRSMLLPEGPASGSARQTGIRSEGWVHAACVATFLAASFRSPPALSPSRLTELTSLTLASTFGDPRIPPLRAGWSTVRELAERSFQEFLATLAKQDLEVFFDHAMRQSDRRRFWSAYVQEIRRSGCVLDRDSRERLAKKLQGHERLRGVADRAYCFRHASKIEAFFLVFDPCVVVEFSDTGNAAYVYERAYFETRVEPSIRKQTVDDESDLKLKSRAIQTVLHHKGWETKTADWLAAQGIHARQHMSR